MAHDRAYPAWTVGALSLEDLVLGLHERCEERRRPDQRPSLEVLG